MRVRLTPKSSLDAVGHITSTVDGPAIATRVRASPTEGEANAAAARLIANWIGVPASSVRLSAGAKGRVKSLTITGDPHRIAASIAEKLKPVPA